MIQAIQTPRRSRSFVRPAITWSLDVPITYDVLVTDDDADVRGFITDALTFEGYTAWSLPNYALTQEVIETIQPSVIVIELQRSTLTKIETIFEYCHQNTSTNQIGMILTSTDTRLLQDLSRSRTDKHVRALSKPFGLADLLSQVQHLIGHSQSV